MTHDHTRPPPPLSPSHTPTSDAIETCDLLAGSGRSSCYAQFGVDAAAVDAYFPRVAALQAALDASPAERGGSSSAPGGGHAKPWRLPQLPW